MIANGAVIGLALERAGLELWAYLPHLPLKRAAIAIPAGAWYCFRARPPVSRRRTLLGAVGATTTVLLGAAAVEAYYAPVGA